MFSNIYTNRHHLRKLGNSKNSIASYWWYALSGRIGDGLLSMLELRANERV